MAIQFLCSACGQPIEVDDDAAGQMVTCPFCRKIVRASATTDLNVHVRAPQANPAAGPMSVSPALTPLQHAIPQPTQANPVAWWSLGCIAFAICLMIILSLSTSDMRQNLGPQPKTPAEMNEYNKKMMVEMQDHPMLLALSAGDCILPIIAVVLAIVALVRGGRPRWPAFVTLGVVAGFIVLMCLSTAVLLSGGGA